MGNIVYCQLCSSHSHSKPGERNVPRQAQAEEFIQMGLYTHADPNSLLQFEEMR